MRDRYLERVNADPGMLLGAGKYDVSRQLTDKRRAEDAGAMPDVRLLDAA